MTTKPRILLAHSPPAVIYPEHGPGRTAKLTNLPPLRKASQC